MINFYDFQRGKPLAVSFLIRKNGLPPLNCSSERASSNCLPAKPLFRLEKLVKCVTLRIETRVELRIQHSSLLGRSVFISFLHHTRIGRRIRSMHHDEKNKIGLTVALSIVVGTIIDLVCL